MIKKLLVAVPLALALVLTALPGAALAHDGTPVSCSLFLQAVAPGVDDVDGVEVKNSGQVLAGVLDCDNDALDGAVTIFPRSKVELQGPTSSFGPFSVRAFNGKLKADAILETFGGDLLEIEIKAKVSGLMVVDSESGLPLIDVNGNVKVVGETLSGKWELEDGDIEGEGTFDITLSPNVVRDFPVLGTPINPLTGAPVDLEDGFPTLAGISSDFSGEVEFDGDGDEEEEEDEDDDDDDD